MYHCVLCRCRQLAGCFGYGLDAMLRLGFARSPPCPGGDRRPFQREEATTTLRQGGFEKSVTGQTPRQQHLENLTDRMDLSPHLSWI